MSRPSRAYDYRRPGFPRMRGDEPAVEAVECDAVWFSPHARG